MVMFDSDLAALYGVETKVLIQAVKRNLKRFPKDFMFQITTEEYDVLRSQFVTSNKSKRGLALSTICFYRTRSSHAVKCFEE